jgi:folate-binding protein YgfZ
LQGWVSLANWGLILVSGDDRADFLHRQTTQDFLKRPADGASLAGLCSAKGRLQASFIAWQAGAETIALACSRDLIAATVKRLNLFVMRSKVRLVDASDTRPLIGLAGDAAACALEQLGITPALQPWHAARVAAGASVVRLADADGVPRWLWLADSPATSPPDLPPLAIGAWDALEAASGCARIVAATAEQFVPQMINFELVGGVDFRKGCYPGQEVVARSQYRGTLKRRAFLFDCDADAAPGQELFHSDDPSQPAGMVANAGRAAPDSPCRVLAEVKIAALASGSLHLGAADGPVLRQAALPYAVPITEA